MTAAIAVLVDQAHGHRVGTTKLRRVVLRIHPPDLARVDALRPRFKVPRAALLRAFVMAGLGLAEEAPSEAPEALREAPATDVPAAEEGGAP